MLSKLIITDITRMANEFICIGAVNENGESFRPLLPAGERIHQSRCCYDGLYIKPFTRILLDLEGNRPLPPHTEDWYCVPGSLRILGFLSNDEKLILLNRIRDLDVKSIFGAQLEQANDQRAFYIHKGFGHRSLGTIRVRRISGFSHQIFNGNWDYRLTFDDENNAQFRMKIVDLTFQTYIDHLRIRGGNSCQQIQYSIMNNFHKCDEIYLRIGLARGWGKFPERCYLQITGVYPFPSFFPNQSFLELLSEIQENNRN